MSKYMQAAKQTFHTNYFQRSLSFLMLILIFAKAWIQPLQTSHALVTVNQLSYNATAAPASRPTEIKPNAFAHWFGRTSNEC